jgi:hypothetical protein
MDPASAPKLDPTQIMQTIYSKPLYASFAPWIAANAHQGLHIFMAFSMATMYSPDDPFFWLHHCNVDRFLHLWLDCLEYDKVSSSSITLTHFCSVNPTTAGTASASNDIVKDTNGVPIVFTADTKITYYVGSNKAPTFLPSTSFPSVRELWTCGTTTKLGWNGLFYRYGPDKLAASVLSGVCAPTNTWTYVNYGAPKKRSDEPATADDLLYENITQTYRYWTEEKGYTPHEAVDKMAMDNCRANPNKWTDEDKKILSGIGLSPIHTKRICDDEEDLDDNDVGMDMSHM